MGRLAVCVCGWSVAILGCGGESSEGSAAAQRSAKIYVANEDAGNLSVVDESTLEVIATIELSAEGASMPMPHNVQVAPDGRSVWATVPPMHDGMEEFVVVVDPATDKVVNRLSLGMGMHLAHVVLDPTSRWAFVTANEAESLLRIDAANVSLDATWALGAGRTPHGIRWCAGKLYVADMAANTLSIVDPSTGDATLLDVGGLAVQTACVADRWVFASLYDTREVVRYGIDKGDLTRIALPSGAQGPIQLYPSPDGATLYVADQGMLMDRPASNRLFEIDVEAATVRSTIEVGAGAHGVVVTDDGMRVWVTNTDEDTLSVVEAATREVVATVPVGAKPNGVACWHKSGGMP